MVDSITTVESQGWLSRLGNSIKGLVAGTLLFFGSFILLFWNEGRAVQTAKSLAEGESAIVSIDAATIDPANEGRLVHLTATATTDEVLSDAEFQISENAIRLNRDVEMFQWVEDRKSEKRKKLGGGTETITTYDYSKQWKSSPIDSSSFQDASHTNPTSFAIPAQSFTAKRVTLGAFTLPSSLVNSISGAETLSVTEANVPETFADRIKVSSSKELYLGENAASPQIGDLKIRFRCTRPSEVTIAAQQSGETFQPYQTSAGDALSMLEMGALSSEQMFQLAKSRNTMLTWILRAVGAILMLVGFMFLTAPLAVLGDVIPLVGSLIQGGAFIVGALVTLVCASTTIALAWIFYRPMVGIPLLVIAVMGVIALFARSRNNLASADPAVLGVADIVD